MHCLAQDTLFTTSSDTIVAKIIEINSDDVSYKMFNYLDGPLIKVKASTLNKIHFASGTVETFSFPTTVINGDTVNYFRQGCKDANRYYLKYHSAGTWGFMSGFFAGPIMGLATTALIADQQPKMQNLNYPSEKLIHNPEYKLGYTVTAHKIKKKRVWSNFGYGILSLAGLFVLVAATTN